MAEPQNAPFLIGSAPPFRRIHLGAALWAPAQGPGFSGFHWVPYRVPAGLAGPSGSRYRAQRRREGFVGSRRQGSDASQTLCRPPAESDCWGHPSPHTPVSGLAVFAVFPQYPLVDQETGWLPLWDASPSS